MQASLGQVEEVRKVQLTGRSTYIVSLPKKWIVELGLKAGDPVVLSKRSDNSLLVYTRDSKPLGQPSAVGLVVSTDEDPHRILRKIISLYLVGYNTVSITSKAGRLTDNQRDTIKSEVRRRLIGTEILADSPLLISIQVLLGYPELSLESALRRLCTIASTMHKEAVASLKDLDLQVAEDVIKSDDEVDRFTLYIIRQLKSAVENDSVLKEIGLENKRDCLGYRIITASVERAADYAVNIARHVLRMKNKPETKVYNKIIQASLLAYEIFEVSTKALFKQDYDLADRAIVMMKQYEVAESEVISSVDLRSEDISSLRLIASNIRGIAESGREIADVVLNVAINRVISPPSKN